MAWCFCQPYGGTDGVLVLTHLPFRREPGSTVSKPWQCWQPLCWSGRRWILQACAQTTDTRLRYPNRCCTNI